MMLTVKQAAERASVSPGIVYQWIGAALLAHHRLGRPGTRGAIRIAEADLEAFLQSCRVEAEQPFTPAPKPAKPQSAFRHLRIS
jgi:excisionase family DNA binding protein